MDKKILEGLKKTYSNLGLPESVLSAHAKLLSGFIPADASDEDKEKVFDRFYRVDKARSRSQGGLGLGLSLAWEIVHQHRGEIKILDNKPCGTIMQVLLPL